MICKIVGCFSNALTIGICRNHKDNSDICLSCLSLSSELNNNDPISLLLL